MFVYKNMMSGFYPTGSDETCHFGLSAVDTKLQKPLSEKEIIPALNLSPLHNTSPFNYNSYGSNRQVILSNNN